MAQTFTSAATSINSTRLPAVYSKAPLSAPFVLDYGCGKYTDHIRTALHKDGRELFPYDPFNQPEEVNSRSIEAVKVSASHRVPVDVVCSNVLNVIDDDATVHQVAKDIERIVRSTGGTGFVTVYEGNRSGIGRRTGADQYQRNEPLRSYLHYFSNATIKSGMIVVS